MGSLALSGPVLAQGGEWGVGHEWAAAMTKVSKEVLFRNRPKRGFAHMDANKDGVIDASDRQKMAEHMQGCMKMMSSMGMMGGGMGMMGGGGMGMMGGGMGAGADTKEHESHHPQQ